MNKIAIFDLDHTLISVDCSNEWIKFMCQRGLIDDTAAYLKQKDLYDQAYRQGQVDMMGFCHFVLQPMLLQPLDKLEEDFMRFAQYITKNFVYPQAWDQLKLHQQQNDTLLLISASIEDLVKAIGLNLGFKIENIIGAETVKYKDNFTGEIALPLSFGKGKYTHYQKWLAQQHTVFEQSIFYSDSINDAPLLSVVDKPVCINPDPKLETLALEHNWPVKSWHMTQSYSCDNITG